MGQRITIYAITESSYDAVVGGHPEEIETIEEIKPIRLEKSWHAIHYILTGSTESTFLTTGTQLDIVDEHCEVHSPNSVIELNQKFARQSAESIMESIDFEGEETQDIYVWGSSREFYDDLKNYLLEFIKFVTFLAKRGDGMLVAIA